MALDIASPNLAGLAAIAANNGGNLNLTVPGALGLQALQVRNSDEESRRNAALQLAQLRQQAEIAMRQRQQQQLEAQQTGAYQQGLLGNAARQMDIQQQGNTLDNQYRMQQLALQQQANQQTGAYQQGSLEVDRQKLIQEQQAKEMAKLLDMNKEELKKKGNFAAYGLYAMKQAKTPAEAQAARMEILKSAVEEKIISADQAKVFAKAPLSQFTNFLEHQTMTLDAVGKYKDMMDADKEQKAGSSKVVLPDGTVIETQAPGNAYNNKLTEQVGDAQIHLERLKNIGNKYADDYLTWEGQAKDIYGWVASKSPTLSEYMPKSKEAKDFRSNRSAFVQDINKLFSAWVKEMTGASFAIQELELRKKEMINEDDDPVAFKSKYDSLINDMQKATSIRMDLLKKGIPVDSKQFEQEFKSEMQQLSEPSDQAKALKKYLLDNGVSEEEADAEIAKRKL